MTPKVEKHEHHVHHEQKKDSEVINDEKHEIKTHGHLSDLPQKTRQEKEALMDEGLEAIYGDHTINFEKLDRKENKLTTLLLTSIIILGVITATMWSGFFVYTKFFEPTRDKEFTLEIAMDDTIVSGQKAQIEVLYTNPTNVPVAALELDLNLPSAFRTYSFNQEPTDLDNLIWDLGSLSGMSDGKIIVDGVWIAQTPSETPVQAHATYKPGNFNSNFEEIAVTYVTTLESTLKATIEGPEEASAGQDLLYNMKIENTGEEAFEQVLINLDLPEGFYLQDSEPSLAAGGPAQWTIAHIDAGAIEEITFSGTFASNIESFQYFDATISLAIDDRSVEQATAQAYTDVLANDMTVQLVANGSSSNTSLDIGSTLRLSISLENTEDIPIEDIDILLDFQADDSIPIKWSSASLDDGTISSAGISWSFDLIEPGEKILLNTSFPLDSTLGVGDADQFRIVASASYQGRTVMSSPIEVSINSQASLSTSIRYFEEDGSALGNGPLPPQVGNTTTYRVIWNIQNSLHDLENIRVSASLPPHVIWAGNATQDIGAITFNDSDKTVTWNLTSLSAGISSVNGSFSISITPDDGDIGSFIKLISGSTLSAKDVTTEQTLSRSTDSLNTDLTDDAQASRVGGIAVE